MADYHEPYEALPEDARDVHRALTSLKEEIEAIDWYNQRVVLCSDPDLRTVLEHNRDEEIEHACLTLEWLRRKMPGWDKNLRRFVLSEASIAELAEEEAEKPAPVNGSTSRDKTLGLGSLKGR
jgi:hypothetical protein